MLVEKYTIQIFNQSTLLTRNMAILVGGKGACQVFIYGLYIVYWGQTQAPPFSLILHTIGLVDNNHRRKRQIVNTHKFKKDKRKM